MTESTQVKELFEKWILDATIKLEEEDLINKIQVYLESQHPEICGKCAPCRDGVVRIEELLSMYLDKSATIKTLTELETLILNLRSSRCSVGLDIGKNLEVVLKNNYNVLYKPVRKY